MPPNSEDFRPTTAELMILQTLWSLGAAASVRAVHEALPRGRAATAYTTTLKLMQIMTEKGLLVREPGGDGARGHLYRPCDPPARTRKRLVRDLIERAFEGSSKQLVMHALSARRPSPVELEEIASLIEHMKAERGDRHE